MTKKERTARFYAEMSRLGFTYAETETLRRAQMTLHRWAERECNGEVERDEETGKAYAVFDTGRGPLVRHRTPDRETGALRRIRETLEARNSRAWILSGETGEYNPKRGNRATDLKFFHQTDPRGCALYLIPAADVSPGEDLAAVYTRGFAVCI